MNDNIERRVCTIVGRWLDGPVTLTTSVEHLRVAYRVCLVEEVRDGWGISIGNSEFREWRRVGDIVDSVERHLGRQEIAA